MTTLRLLLLPLAGCLVTSATAADMILNEYNAVGDTAFLENDGSDPFWGQRLGNGGDWFELVVITDHLDIRGWDLVIDNDVDSPDEEQFILTLAVDDVWADLRSGTIITVSQDLANNVADYQPELGRWWINVRAADTTDGTYITASNFSVSNNMWQLTIRDATDQVVFGPAGEGISPVSGVGNDEVLKLEADPSAAITAGSLFYNDGASSTFASGNEWNGGADVQDFSVLRSVVPFTPLTAVRINEVNTHTDLPDEDWIELINTTAGPIDIGGWFLSDDFDELELQKYQIPGPMVIPAGGFVVLVQSELGFALSSMGDQVVLSEGDGVGGMTGARDFIDFGAIQNGISFGRVPDGTGRLYRMAEQTPGALNASPIVGPVVINEIMYHPLEVKEGPPDIDYEYIELLNTSDDPVNLFEDYGVQGLYPWALTGGIQFSFPTDAVIGPGEVVAVVTFDPEANNAALQTLKSLYNLCSSNVYGPYAGVLSNFSDTVRVRVPDTPDMKGDAPLVTVDEVTYVDFGDWPVEADGQGPSLQRVDPQDVADVATNWAASAAPRGTLLRPNTDGAVCAIIGDCADLNRDGLRDDGCVWWGCVDGHCIGTDIGFGDMGGQFGVCNPDCATDGNDRFHALNCFANVDPNSPPPSGYTCEFDPPNAMNVDAGGQFGSCQPDGVCDGNDAFAALNAFGGMTTCTCAAGAPAPEFAPQVIDQAAVRLRATRERVRPGGRFEIEVSLDNEISDLRGYQLHLGVTGGERGQIRLVDITIEDHATSKTTEHAFGGLEYWHAFNVHTLQMVAGMDGAGVATAAGAYLATFVFEASADCAGSFEITLMSDPRDATNRTFLFPTLAHGQIEVTSATAARVHVGRAQRSRAYD